MIAVYRSIQILSTAISQLSIDVERGGHVLTGDKVPSWVRQPSLRQSRSDFFDEIVTCLATTGNAYLKVSKSDRGEILDVDVLHPGECVPALLEDGTRVVDWRGRRYGPADIQHLALMRLSGQPGGLGPIEAARTDLQGARDIRDYAANWYQAGPPPAILTTDQQVTSEQMRIMRNSWNYLDADGKPLPVDENPSRIRVLGNGVRYQPVLISPADAQWLEARKFSTTEIARLFGVPPSLLLAAIDGSSMTYQNIEQEWIQFSRFTLSMYTRKIEEALTTLAPLGQTIRFNFESLLRSDTKTRYEAHQIGLAAGFLTINEVRRIESLPPLPEGTANEQA